VVWLSRQVPDPPENVIKVIVDGNDLRPALGEFKEQLTDALKNHSLIITLDIIRYQVLLWYFHCIVDMDSLALELESLNRLLESFNRK
jgi:hypothetical protein